MNLDSCQMLGTRRQIECGFCQNGDRSLRTARRIRVGNFEEPETDRTEMSRRKLFGTGPAKFTGNCENAAIEMPVDCGFKLK